MSVFVSQNSQECNFSTNESWVILSPIEQNIKHKIEAAGTPLKDWDINIYRGILTGYNEAFIIDGKKKDELIAEDPKSADIIRPILRGRDIKRYGYEFADLWLIYVPWHFPLHNDSSIIGPSAIAEAHFRQQYPGVYNHLLSHKENLSNRNKAETGIRYEWYALQRWGANYRDDFSKQKIVWKRVGSLLKFCYDNSGIFALDSTCFATGEHIKYLVAFLNSNVGNYLLRDSPKTGTGDLLVSVQAITPIIVPIPEKEFEEQIDSLTDQLITCINSDVEKSINTAFYNLFKFSAEEIEFIEFQ